MARRFGARSSSAVDNVSGTSAPTANDDSSADYEIGSLWVDIVSDEVYVCVDASVGAAVWKHLSADGVGGSSWPTRGEDGVLEETIPRNAACPSVAPGTGFSWGSWQQLEASTPADFLMVGLQANILLQSSDAGLHLTSVEVELGVGAASSEAAIAAFVTAAPAYTNGALAAISRSIPVGPRIIPSGTRVSARASISDASGMGGEVYLYPVGYYGTPAASVADYDFGSWVGGDYAPGQLYATPSRSYLSVSPGAFGTGYGSWVEAIASASSDLLVRGVAVKKSVAGAAHAYWQFGTGAASAEVARMMVPVPLRASLNAGMQQAIRPLLVNSGERLAIRGRGAYATAHNIQIIYEVL